MNMTERFKRQLTLAHVSGIPVRADMRWFLVIALMSALIAASVVQLDGGFGIVAGAVFGLAATLVFFLSIFLHEYAHAAIARMEGLEVFEIVLHPFGGLTRFRHEPETPRAEFLIAIAGPATSFVLAVLFAGLATVATSLEASVLVILAGTLSILNFLIAVFNMLPGYPLDGGRILRAYLWRSGRDMNEATILTGRCGQAIAAVLVALGLAVVILRQEFFTGFWAVLVGLFLYDSAKGIIAEVNKLKRRIVDDVMMLPMAVDPEMNVQDFVDDMLPLSRQAIFPVAADRRLFGMLLLEDLKKHDRAVWRTTPVKEAMRPVEDKHFLEAGTPLGVAHETTRTNGIGAVCVVDRGGRLVGIFFGLRHRG
jgi:Zn-dependent protease